ncbi:hypothetical protein A5674_19980 [Mycobacterium malmoense]|nr:hypothetical protein A5674_19980 [Mycobacterium malmoense]
MGAIRATESCVNWGTWGRNVYSASPAQCGTWAASIGSPIRVLRTVEGLDPDWLRSTLSSWATSCTRVTHQLS